MKKKKTIKIANIYATVTVTTTTTTNRKIIKKLS